MIYDFDTVINRSGTTSLKWDRYPQDVLPLWVADMDFPSPEPVIRALRERVDHGVFGYGVAPPALSDVFCDRLDRLYGWPVTPDELVFVPGVVTGFNVACRALTQPGDGLLVQTPAYPPILSAAGNNHLRQVSVGFIRDENDYYSFDPHPFGTAISDDCRLFLLCNPHNPLGRVFSRQELEGIAEKCLEQDTLICSDEIHCDLLYDGIRHTPIASMDPEVASRTVTLMAPSKTFNIAGLSCSIAIIPNEELRRRFIAACAGLVPGVAVMGYVAALAAYKEGEEWLRQVLTYLRRNRDFVVETVNAHMPGLRTHKPEATFLAWLDCRSADLPGGPYRFFLDRARVALNDGSSFGQGEEGFVRLNFGCPRATLTEALERMRSALGNAR